MTQPVHFESTLQAQTPEPTPDHFFEAMVAYQRTAALKAALDLDIFTAIAAGATSVSRIANAVHGYPRAVRMLCDSLVALGFLTKSEATYGLTIDSARFLDRHSPAYVGSAANFLASPAVTEAFTDLASVVRGTTNVRERKSPRDLGPEAWAVFARSMAPLAYRVAQETAKLLDDERFIKVLDVAAGHGMFGIAVAQQNPIATIVAVDWPSVLQVASENANRFRVSGRYQLLPGDAHEVQLGFGYDAVLMPNVLHLWDRSKNLVFLKRIHAALSSGGRVVIVEFLPNEDRVTPKVPAMFALNLLANTSAGDLYTLQDYKSMLKEAAFTNVETHPLPSTPHTAIVAIK